MSRVRFGELVKDVKSTVDRNNNPYEFYVAGNHMDTEDLKIHRKGRFATDDVGPAFIREFKTGQILYGSRRTYLKKVAVADFDGVTANTTFVFETKDEAKLLQALLPFVMLSEGFTQWSIMKSKGSTNPYVLFSDLADYEFELPDIEKQRELAKILWAIDKTKKTYQKLLQKTDELVKSRFIEMFGDPFENPLRWEIRSFASLGNWKSGGTPSRNVPEYFKGDINWYSAGELNERYLKGSLEKITDKAVKESAAKLFKAGSMLVGMYDTAALKLGILVEDSASNQACANILPFDDVNIVWFYEAIQSMKDKLLMKRQGGRQRNLSLALIKSFEVPLPPVELQNQFADFIGQADNAKFALEQSISNLEFTIKALMSKSFG